MSCCGQRRRQIVAVEPPFVRVQRSVSNAKVALFEYTGTTAMTVVGPISGVKYRFGSPGARLRVDVRDVASMTFVPNLQQLE